MAAFVAYIPEKCLFVGMCYGIPVFSDDLPFDFPWVVSTFQTPQTGVHFLVLKLRLPNRFRFKTIKNPSAESGGATLQDLRDAGMRDYIGALERSSLAATPPQGVA